MILQPAASESLFLVALGAPASAGRADRALQPKAVAA